MSEEHNKKGFFASITDRFKSTMGSAPSNAEHSNDNDQIANENPPTMRDREKLGGDLVERVYPNTLGNMSGEHASSDIPRKGTAL